MKDKTVGILGGMGPEATIDLFARIVKHTHAKKDDDHLRIIIDNNPKMPSRQDAILKGGESPVPAMRETARNLERAGADFIIIGANTPHYFYDEIKDAVRIPFLHIIEEAVKANINMIATGVIMRDNENFYRKLIEIVEEGQGECLLVYLTATKEVVNNRIDSDSRKELKKISTLEKLNEWTRQYPESYEKIQYGKQIAIDTSNVSAVVVAEQIREKYKL